MREWLSREAGSRRGAEACLALEFEQTLGGVRDRLAETREACALLETGQELPLGGAQDVRAILEKLERGAVLAGSDFVQILDTLRAARRVSSFLTARADAAPRLADLGRTLPDLTALDAEIARVITPRGELRESASSELRKARQRTEACEREVKDRLGRLLRDERVLAALQDRYSTMRENRPVLPVRADARQRVRGIVHDVSSSGTTLFIEPEAIVEVGNRLRIAETEVRRETERLLRELAARASTERVALVALGATLEKLDVSMARGRLSLRLGGTEPEFGPSVPLRLVGLRHPLLELDAGLGREEVVANDVELPEGARGLVISGPNAGGKTVLAKAIALAALSVRAGLYPACDQRSSMPAFDAVYADIGDEQDLRAGLSTFSARMSNLAGILAAERACPLVIVDEIGEGTEPGEGAALAQAILERLVERDAFVVATTHFNRLKELAGADPRFGNASAEFDIETLLPTFRVRMGQPGSSGATFVAERMGLPPELVERARVLLDGDDRRLEALTRSLSELRQELESERRMAAEVREQTEEVRSEYEARLGALRAAREEALAAMKGELDAAFEEARAEVASVVRALQRGETAPGPRANRARRELEEIRSRVEQVEREQPRPDPRKASVPIDWQRVEPGAQLEVEGLSGGVVLLEKSDGKRRVAVRAGAVRMQVAGSRVRRVLGAEAAPASSAAGVNPIRPPAPEFRTGLALASASCDLRGLRVADALERANAHLHSVLGSGLRRLLFIHGHGTGALRAAIREWLRDLPEVEEFTPGEAAEGGNGVTVVRLAY